MNVLASRPNHLTRSRRAPVAVGTAVACLGLITACGSTVQYAGEAQELGSQLDRQVSTGDVPPATQGVSPSGTSDGQGSGPSTVPGLAPGQRPGTTGLPNTPLPTTDPVNRRPIKIGFLTVNYEKAYSGVGLSAGEGFDWKANYRALVTGLNKQGGVAGRIIKPTFYEIDGTSASYTSASQEACAAFTQDARVDVVLSYAVNVDVLSKCFSDAGIAQIDSETSTRGDTEELRHYADLIAPEAVTVDKYSGAVITRSLESGWLSPKNKLGVFIEGCPGNINAYDRIVAPLARRLGIGIEKFTTICIRGFADVGQVASAIQAAALQFHSNGVDRVTYLSTAEAGIHGLFAKNAEKQKWYPTYLLTSNAKVVQNTQDTTNFEGQVPNMRGLGWAPGWDTHDPAWSRAQVGLQSRCKALAHTGGVAFPAARGPQENQNPYMECDTLLLLEKLLGITRGSTALRTVMAAVDRLGTSYVSPVTVGGATFFRPDSRTGARDARLFSYKASCRCFSYDTAPQALP